VTYKATADAATKTTPAEFGITISATAGAGQPPLPNSAPVVLAAGGSIIL